MTKADWSQTTLEAKLGEPLMVDDPLITTAQAAAVLGVDVNGVRKFTQGGLLRRRGPHRSPRQFLLSEVRDLGRDRLAGRAGRPIEGRDGPRLTLAEAGEILGVPAPIVSHYYRSGDLPHSFPGRYPVLQREVEDLARRLAERLTVQEAADLLRWTTEGVRQLLRKGTLTRQPDQVRPVRLDQVADLIAGGWRPPAGLDRAPLPGTVPT